MGFEFRMPSITGASEKEQLAQLKSYLYQFIPQLQWALNTLETSAGKTSYTVQQVSGGASSVQGGSSGQSSGLNFSEIKSLIIKSADIVNAYYEEINSRLSSSYVAISDFGTYTETVESIKTQTSSYEETLINHTATIDSAIKGLESDIDVSVKAWIKTGEIYEDANGPVYGVEIGQTNYTDTGEKKFSTMLRITSGRITFYDDSGYEIAYISGTKLYIQKAEILASLIIGGLEDTVTESGDVITKWVGKE